MVPCPPAQRESVSRERKEGIREEGGGGDAGQMASSALWWFVLFSKHHMLANSNPSCAATMLTGAQLLVMTAGCCLYRVPAVAARCLKCNTDTSSYAA